MSQVLIISKTRMGLNGICIGGITIPELRSVRLLNADGSYHQRNTEFEIGQLWNIQFVNAPNILPPHYENIWVNAREKIGEIEDLNILIDSKELEPIVWGGHPQDLFEGLLHWTGSRHGYISEETGIPIESTGFWVSDRDITLEGNYYVYFDDYRRYEFKYVGVVPAINLISAGTKVRVSLAKWWRPDNVEIENRCYLQLSGWY